MSSVPPSSYAHASPYCEGSTLYEIDRRMVLGLLEIGGGKSSLETLSSVLNMPKALSGDAYLDAVRKVKDVVEKKASFSMEKAAMKSMKFLALLLKLKCGVQGYV